jgi:hypothetical protein
MASISGSRAAGVFHHIGPEHADLFLRIDFRWSQRIAEGEVIR